MVRPAGEGFSVPGADPSRVRRRRASLIRTDTRPRWGVFGYDSWAKVGLANLHSFQAVVEDDGEDEGDGEGEEDGEGLRDGGGDGEGDFDGEEEDEGDFDGEGDRDGSACMAVGDTDGTNAGGI